MNVRAHVLWLDITQESQISGFCCHLVSCHMPSLPMSGAIEELCEPGDATGASWTAEMPAVEFRFHFECKI